MKKILAVIGAVAAVGILYACGGSSSSTAVVGTPITNKADAAKTAYASKTLASSFASGSSFPSLGSLVGKQTSDQPVNGHKVLSTIRDVQQIVSGLVEKQKTLGKQVGATTTPQSCTDGGNMSIDTTSNPMIITFAACYMNNEYKNGTISFPTGLGSSTSSGAMTANFTSIDYATSAYTTKTHKSVMNMTMSIAAFNAATGSSNFTMNGTQETIDYDATGITGTSDKQTFGNFSLNMTESTSGSTANTNMTMNGSISMNTYKDAASTIIDTASQMTFQNLILTEAFDTTTYTTALTMNGTFTIKTIPACNDGTFVISTQQAITTTSAGVTTGKMTVNGVVMVFNADGTVSATIGGVPQIITGSDYANACSLSF